MEVRSFLFLLCDRLLIVHLGGSMQLIKISRKKNGFGQEKDLTTTAAIESILEIHFALLILCQSQASYTLISTSVSLC